MIKNYNPVMAARNAMRRAFSRSPVVIEMMSKNKRKVPRYNKDGTRAKVDAAEYLCGVCGKWKRSSKNSKVAVDHKKPVVDPDIGFIDFNTYFKRLWCDESNLQVICGECHNIKSNAEWVIRRLKDDEKLVSELEKCNDQKIIKKALRRLKKKLNIYPSNLQDRIKILIGT